jgi:hypothetical protein
MSQQITRPTKTKLRTANNLADFLGMSIHWIYKRTQQGAEDPPPRCPGLKRLRFNLQDKNFQSWIERQIGSVDFAHDPM